MKIKVLENLDAISAELAKLILGRIELSIRNNKPYYLALSGGDTPRQLYEQLNSLLEQSDDNFTDQLGVVQIDERWVLKNNPKSNQKMISETLKITSKLENYLPIPTLDMYPDVSDSVADYETTMKQLISFNDYINLGIFGMGEDGHTASLFPDDPILDELTNKFVVSGYIESIGETRITLTPGLFQHIRQKVFIITGGEKGSILKHALTTKKAKVFPILLALDNQSLVFMDQEAYDAYKA
ncbi:MAG: 6-phosphogluconolactonase [Candidatus Kariarchaeaceae archaeon]